MKQLIVRTLPLAIIFLVAACNSSQTSEESNNPQETDNTTTEAAATPSSTGAVTVKNDEINAIYHQYVNLTQALAKGNVAEAKIAGSAIEAGARNTEGGAGIAKAAGTIATASDIDAQRKAYSQMSNNLIALVKKAGVSNGALYVDYCFMGLGENKGAYWISSSNEVTNPYLGGKMLQCGNVKDTIQ